jgi:hypothetical protein
MKDQDVSITKLLNSISKSLKDRAETSVPQTSGETIRSEKVHRFTLTVPRAGGGAVDKGTVHRARLALSMPLPS